MKSKHPEAETNRRGFLKGAIGVGGTVAATAVIGGGVAVANDSEDLIEEPSVEAVGYHETEHVRTYYDKARF